jgi:hypothetical protein
MKFTLQPHQSAGLTAVKTDKDGHASIAVKFLDGIRTFIPNFILLSIKQNKQTPWPLVRERTIPTDRPPLVEEI